MTQIERKVLAMKEALAEYEKKKWGVKTKDHTVANMLNKKFHLRGKYKVRMYAVARIGTGEERMDSKEKKQARPKRRESGMRKEGSGCP